MGNSSRWHVLTSASTVVFAVLLDSTIVGVALPTMDDDLGLSTVGSHWVVNAYLLTFAILAAPGGRFADLIGHRRAFALSTAAFAAASVACGLAQSGAWLIAARAVQGVFAAVMLPAALALISNAFGDDERAKAIGIWGGVGTIGLALGPLLGGTLTEFADWRVIFFVNVPIAAVGIALILAVDTRSLDVGGAPRSRFDWRGFLALTVTLGALVTALMQVTEWGWGSAPTLSFAAVGVAAGVALVLIERRATDPLIDLAILRDRTFAAANIVMLCLQFTMVSITVFLAIYLQASEELSPALAGLATVPALILVPIANAVAGALVTTVGQRRLMLAGCVATAVSLAWIAAFAGAAYWLIVPGLLLWGVGMPLATNPSMTAAMESVEAQRRALVGGVVQTTRQLGLVLGVAVISVVTVSVGGSGLGTDGDDPSGRGYRLAFLLCAILMAGAAVAARALLPRPDRSAGSANTPSDGPS